MSGKQYPGWAFLVAGLFIGLFIAFLFYLHQQPDTDKSSLTDAKDNISKIREEKIKANQEKTIKDKPDFDFYKILPELEVVIPDFDTQTPTKNQPEATDNTPNTVDKTQADYLLQVGSFSDNAQAEKFKAKLAFLGLQAFIEPVSINNKNWYRVRLGPYQNKGDLVKEQKRLNENAIKSIVLQIKD